MKQAPCLIKAHAEVHSCNFVPLMERPVFSKAVFVDTKVYCTIFILFQLGVQLKSYF